MLNKDNQITIGHKRKKNYQSMLHNYIADKKRGIGWPLEDLQSLQGLTSYYKMVEGDTINRIIAHINTKEGVDVIRMIKNDIG